MSIQSSYVYYSIPTNLNIHLNESQFTLLIYLRRKLGVHKRVLLFIPWNFFSVITVTGIFLSVLFYFVSNFESFFWYFTISDLFISCRLIWGIWEEYFTLPCNKHQVPLGRGRECLQAWDGLTSVYIERPDRVRFLYLK